MSVGNQDTDARGKAWDSPLLRRAILIVAAIGFVFGLVVSYRANPDILTGVSIAPLVVLALVGIPLTVLLNSAEFSLSARLIGQQVGLAQSAEVTIIGSVANMLPIPGGTMVRIAALKAKGATLGRGTAATMIVAVLWIGVALIYAGAWIMAIATDWQQLAPAIIVAGLLALAGAIGMSIRLGSELRVVAMLAGLKAGLVVLDAFRIYLCFLALDGGGSFAQASVLTASSVVGAAVSIVPAGLGIREGTAALLGPVVFLPASTAYLATSLNRILGLAVMAPVAVVLGLRHKA